MVTVKQMPDGVDIEMVQGDDIQILITINQDLTGYALDCHVEDDPNIPFTITPVDLTLGKFYISLTKIQTALLKGQRPWTLEWDDIALNHRTIIQGSLKVARNV